MEKNKNTGTLVRWNDSKGFGFIKTEQDSQDIFIHITELKHMKRRPVINDTIHFETETGSDGRNKAVNANIKGVDSNQQSAKEPEKANPKSNPSSFPKLVFIMVFMLLLAYGYKYFTENSSDTSDTQSVITVPTKPDY